MKKITETAENIMKEETIEGESKLIVSEEDQSDPIAENENGSNPTEEDSEQPKSKTGRVINAKHVRIRKAPSLDAEVLDIVSEGEQTTILGEELGFYKIQSMKGIIGYITSKYFKED